MKTYLRMAAVVIFTSSLVGCMSGSHCKRCCGTPEVRGYAPIVTPVPVAPPCPTCAPTPVPVVPAAPVIQPAPSYRAPGVIVPG